MHILHSLSYTQKQSLRGVFQESCSMNDLDSLKENIHAVTSTEFFCNYSAYLQQKALFREHFWRTVSVYGFKYRGYKCSGSL